MPSRRRYGYIPPIAQCSRETESAVITRSHHTAVMPNRVGASHKPAVSDAEPALTTIVSAWHGYAADRDDLTLRYALHACGRRQPRRPAEGGPAMLLKPLMSVDGACAAHQYCSAAQAILEGYQLSGAILMDMAVAIISRRTGSYSRISLNPPHPQPRHLPRGAILKPPCWLNEINSSSTPSAATRDIAAASV